MRAIDITGKRFGKLIVLGKTKNKINEHIVWRCLCDCGKEKLVISNNLGRGTLSCGCMRMNKMKDSNTRHGQTINYKRTREYATWEGLKQRCLNPKNPNYKNYGGRGIKVCAEWLHSFENFLGYLKDNGMYPKPVGMSIDRINNNGNYEQGNIRWANQSQQALNQRHSKRAA